MGLLIMQKEAFSMPLMAEALGIAGRYHGEVSQYDEPVDPDYERYTAVEEAGLLRCFTLREEGELKGFASCYLETQIHHSSHFRAAVDTIYIEPEARIGMTGPRFLHKIEEELRAEGVKSISIASGLKHNISNLLKRMGYEPHEIIHTKVI